jgi:type IX secretion system substrate protein
MKIIVFIILLSACIFSKNKDTNFKKTPVDSIEYHEYIIDSGDLRNYVSNNTFTSRGNDRFTFSIGSTDENMPSMDWSEGGYSPNNYLYSGNFYIGYNNDIIRFSTKTSNDFKVYHTNPEMNRISYSMTDDSADVSHKVGIKCKCDIYGYPQDAFDDFLIYEYKITNKSNQRLENIYTGLFIDPDVSSAGGGSGARAYSRDDLPDYYLGTDKNGEPESISYLYDGDSPNINGNDIGGILNPKESLGYIGSRVLKCPETEHGTPANQQSGHGWYDWGSDPDPQLGTEHYNLMKREDFKPQPNSPSDFRYMQSMGPWDIDAGEQITIALGIGIGIGLDGLKKTLQNAYDTYRTNELAPKILDYYPKSDTVITYIGESIKFCVQADDSNLYRWGFNEYLLNNPDSTYVYNATNFHLGTNILRGTVTDNQYTRNRYWTLIVKPTKKYELAQNYPNPFNGTTNIPFELQKDGKVSITIYDVLGRKVKTLINKPYTFGKHTISWDGTDDNGKNISSGIYFYQIKSNNYSKTKRLLLLR